MGPLLSKSNQLIVSDSLAITSTAVRERDSLVLLSIVGKDEVLQCHLHSNPLLIRQRRPDVVGFCYRGLVWFQNHLL